MHPDPGNDETIAADVGRAGGAGPPTHDAETRDDQGSAGEPVARARISRYAVLEVLGHGGMGIVYKAYDPVLDRAVALKLLRGSGSASRGDRMLREAQALAQVSHPNVIAVHDVGTVGNDIYLAMEFVPGSTLSAWLVQAPRPGAAAILSGFLQAGAGLSAAHAARLIHRDFKPSNVIVGEDGRVRVLDFGLARGVAATDAMAETSLLDESVDSVSGPTTERGDRSRRLVDADVTADGAILGTPRYMAPEQHAREPLSPAADQFSFCVALWEALTGGHPFGEDYGTQWTARRRRLVPDAEQAARLPRHLRTALVRGLAIAPAARWPSMAALLGALRRDVTRARQRAVVAAVVTAAIGSGVALVARSAPPQVEPCSEGDGRVAAVWNPAVASEVASAHARSGWPGAAAAGAQVASALDAYSRAWSSEYRAVCRATRVTGDASESLLDRRVGCLDRRLAELRATTELLGQGGPEVIARSARLVAALGDVKACGDRLASVGPAPPSDPALREHIQRLGDDLARAQAMSQVERVSEARRLAEDTARAAVRTGYGPIEVEADIRLGTLQVLDSDGAAGLVTLSRAIELAGAVGDDLLLADAIVSFAHAFNHGVHEPGKVLDLRPVMAAVIAAAGSPPALVLRQHASLADAFDELGRFDDAARERRAALLTAEQHLGADDPRTVRALVKLAAAERFAGSRIAARHRVAEAVARTERRFGPDHPELYDVLVHAAAVEGNDGDVALAERYIRRAIAIGEATLPTHPRMHSAQTQLGTTLVQLGRWNEAEVALLRAAELAEKATPPDPTALADIHGWLGDVAKKTRGLPAARPHYERVRSYYRSAGRHDDPFLGDALAIWADAECEAREPARAAPLLEEARAILAHRKDRWRFKVVIAEASCALVAGDPRRASQLAQQVIDGLADTDGRDDRAEARFVLARATWTLGSRARALAAARASLDDLAGSSRERAQEIAAWLAARS